MSITDELREWVTGAKPAVVDGCSVSVGTMTYGCKKALLAIADRIDAEYQKALDERKAKNGDMWLKGYAVCHEELMEGHPVIVADLEKAGWVKLPKDADGEPIHIGDVMEWPTTGETFEVVGIGDGVLFYVEYDEKRADWTVASTKRHYHAPTVEDVLREFGRGWHEQMNGPETFDIADYVERYAAKLQLREDA